MLLPYIVLALMLLFPRLVRYTLDREVVAAKKVTVVFEYRVTWPGLGAVCVKARMLLGLW
jgi:hypothetical protein